MPPNTTQESAARTRLEAFLRSAGVRFAFLEPGVPMPTVPLAAAAIGVEPDQIIKSLLFVGADDRAVLAIAAGTARIDRGLLAGIAGIARPKLADPSTVLRRTGYPAGGVAPVGHAEPLPVVVDRGVMRHSVVFGGGGGETLLLRIAPADIVALTGAVVADIVAAEHASP